MELLVAAIIAVSSQVTDVTVYNDRAQVVRTAEVELQEGINKLRFEDLPEAIDSRGIQVDGSGVATVLDVRYKVEDLDEIPQAAWKELHAAQEDLAQGEKAILQRIEVLRQSKQFLAQIGSKVTHKADTEGEPELDPESWEKMLALYTGKNTEYDAGIRNAETELKEVREALHKVRADIAAKGADSRKQRRVVEVDLEAAKAGKATIKLSYIVHGPKWIPTYDVRVDTETREMEMKYFALVRQSTGEDWSNVALNLSTANPGLGGQHPELSPWRISMRAPQQIKGKSWGVYGKPLLSETADSSLVLCNAFAPETANRFESSVAGITPAASDAPAPVEVRATTASRQGASVVFAVKGGSTIESDNVEHRVAVSSVTLPAHFRYSAVPKVDPYAYLKAKASNSGKHPFLGGKANIYLDGSYVATSALEMVAPGEEFWVFLGADESMKVEHKLIKRYQSKEGLRGKTVRHTFEYLMTVKNTHGVAEEIIVWDQLPISGSEGLKVKLLNPKYSKDTDTLKMDDEQRLSWFRKLEPGAEWKIPFSFQVEAPKGMTVSGLE